MSLLSFQKVYYIFYIFIPYCFIKQYRVLNCIENIFDMMFENRNNNINYVRPIGITLQSGNGNISFSGIKMIKPPTGLFFCYYYSSSKYSYADFFL